MLLQRCSAAISFLLLLMALHVQAANYSLAPLPYPANALEPVIDAKTMTLHHDKHHRAYVEALNKAVADVPGLQKTSLEALLEKAGSMPDEVRNNAGGHWNHSFFWETMAPVAEAIKPSSSLQEAIDRKFGSLQGLKNQFRRAGEDIFGSGWVWLIVNEDGELQITSTPNQDNPLMDVAEQKGEPILGNDMWEHAYYLKHNNRREEYLDAWWAVVNWKKVAERFENAHQKRTEQNER